MDTGEFLNLATEKLGPAAAANLVTQANIATIHEVLMSKGIVTKQEWDEGLATQLEKFGRNLDKLQALFDE